MTVRSGTVSNAGSFVLIDAWIKPTVHHEGKFWWAETRALDGAYMSHAASSLRQLLDEWRQLCIFTMTPNVTTN